jgi:hypothetical protein
MTDLSYSCRPSILDTEVTWTLTSSALESSNGTRVPFDQIVAVRLYGFATSAVAKGRVPARGTLRCVIRPVHGQALVLTSSHFLALGRFEDRSAVFEPFIHALLQRVRAARPAAQVLVGMPPALWWLWCAIGVGCALVSSFGVIILVVELCTQGHPSLELLVLLPVVAGMLLSTRAILSLLRSGRSRPFNPE